MSVKKIWLSLIATMLFGWAFAQNGAPAPLPFDTAVVKGTLPNGMTYYIQHNANPPQRAFFYIAQKVGSVQEEENQRGLAHFLEHMCFNGSEHFPGNAIIEFCQRIGVQYGADLNAYTAADRTVYNINNVPTTDEKNLDSCLLILYDWSHALTLDPKEIDKERGVIHEEWRMRSSAMMRILERQLPTLMPGSRYGERLPIGLMSVVDNFKPEALRAYYEKWYRPDLQGLVIVGDIDVKQMEQKVKDVFSGIKMPENPAKFEYYDVPDNPQPIIVVDKDKEISTPDVTLMVKHDPLPRELRQTAAAIPMDYITTVLDQMFSYRFDDLMQNPDAPYNNLSAGDGEFILASTKEAFQFSVTPKDGQTEEATKGLLREVLRAARFGFTESEYDRAKTQFLSDLDQAREARKKIKSGRLVNECIENFLEGTLKTNFETEYELYKQMAGAIPLQIVNAYLGKLIGKLDTNVVILATFPERDTVKVTEAAVFGKILSDVKAEDLKPYEAKTVDARLIEKEPKAGTIKKELPANKLGYKTLILSNGIKILYKTTDFDESKILFNAVSPGGTAKIPTSEIDNADLFGAVMADNGLGRYNGVDLRRALTGRQVTLTPMLRHYSEQFGGNASPRDLRTLMQLVYLSFTELNYDTLNYRTVMKNMEQELRGRNARPMSALQDSVTTRLYGYNLRERPLTLESLGRVTYDGIRKIYNERFANAGDFTFIFTGAVNEDSLRLLSCQYLAALPTKGKKEKQVDDGVRLWSGLQTCDFKRKMETPMAYLLQLWNSPEPYSVKNDVVAEAAGRVLETIYLQTVREQHSFSYSVQTDCSPFEIPDHHQVMETICPVKPEKCDSALDIIEKELKTLVAGASQEQYLPKVKEQMLKIYENNQRENRYWHSLAADLILRGRDGHEGQREAIESVTAADVTNFLSDVMKHGNRLTIIMRPE